MTTLSERAMLVTLSISQWTARKLDRAETLEVNRRHGLTVEAARVNKNLLPFGDKLERVHATTGLIRKDFARRTLPWGIDGVNILKASAYMDFTTIVRGWMDDWHAAVDEFVATYPAAKEEARLLLNGMFHEEDYPSVEDMRRRFGFSIRFMPVPADTDWRIDVGDAERARLQQAITEQVVQAEAAAMGETWRRIYEMVAKARDRLADPDAIFRDSLVENAKELCALLPSLNITDDPALERVRQEIEGSLCRHTPDTLRSDPVIRKDVAASMDDVMSKMAGFFRA